MNLKVKLSREQRKLEKRKEEVLEAIHRNTAKYTRRKFLLQKDDSEVEDLNDYSLHFEEKFKRKLQLRRKVLSLLSNLLP